MGTLQEQKCVHVVVAIILNAKQEVLVSRRKLDAHLGGLLEFPGGKVEENESAINALRRELSEELKIKVSRFTPLIKIPYSYPDQNVLLEVYLVDDFNGSECANEGQELFWKNIESLNDDDFPAANYGILRALRLPKIFPVTPEFSINPENFLNNFEQVVRRNSIKIIQLRSHELKESEYIKLANKCATLCKRYDVKLILNARISVLSVVDDAGLHLTSSRLLRTNKRPLSDQNIVGGSCHSLQEIQHANSLGLDYVILGPVKEKVTVENSVNLGWQGFAALAKESAIPVYAIGGLGIDDEGVSIKYGGQGIAAIRGIWNIAD